MISIVIFWYEGLDTPTFTPSPLITVKKHISIDNGNSWLDAETAPGPSVNEGTALQFKFVVTNTGNVSLSNLTLFDSDFNVSAVVKKDPLHPEESFQYILTGITAVAGQHENTATATGSYGGFVYSDTDKAHYAGVKAGAPSISVKKYVSVDGGVKWDDAQLAPGPKALVGNKVQFKFVVTNTGNVPLTDLTLIDSKLSLSGATKPASLLPGSSFEYVLTGVDVKEGQHENTATATGRHGSITYSASDKAHYKGEKTISDAPAITVKKYVSVDGGVTWEDAQSAPGPSAVIGSEVRFKFVVTNTGNVLLTNLTLSDTVYTLNVNLPGSLDPGKNYEYILTGVKAESGQHSNIATATGRYGTRTELDNDSAHYLGKGETITPTPPTGGYLSITGVVGLLLFAGGILLGRRKLNLR
jgi:uncharacterized repeat protein (TIGR01451 family)